MKKVAELSVFFPAFNEEDNIASTVLKASKILKKVAKKWEILVIDDGSTDRTRSIVKRLVKNNNNIRLIVHKKNKGYGGAIKTGLQNVKYKLICYTDSDGQFDFQEITKFLAKIKKADLVLGFRKKRTDSLLRRLIAWLLRAWNFILFGLSIKDVDCGFKLFKKSVVKKIGTLKTESAITETEFVTRAKIAGFNIRQVGVSHYSRKEGEQTGGKIKIIFLALRESFKMMPVIYGEIFKKNKNIIVPLLLILLLAAFLRLYKIEDFMVFLGDEGRDALVVKRMIVDKKFTLLGPVTSVGKMHLGPLYYYMMVIPLILARFNPVGPAIMVAIFGILTVLLVYLICKEFVNKKIALTTAFLYSFSPVVVNFSSSSWNPNTVPFFALLSLFCLLRAYKGKVKYLIYPILSVAILAQLHFMALVIIPFVILMLVLIFIRFLKENKTRSFIIYNLISLILGLIVFFPFIWFDLRHNFINIKEIISFLSTNSAIARHQIPLLYNFYRIVLQLYSSLLASGNNFFGNIFIALSFFGILTAFKFKKNKPFILIFYVYFIFGVLTASLYGGNLNNYYFGFLFPMPFILSLMFVNFFKNKIIKNGLFLIISLVILFLNFPNNKMFQKNTYSQKKKAEGIARAIVDDADGESFNLVLFTPARDFRALSIRYFAEVFSGRLISFEDYSQDKYLYAIVEDGTKDPASINIFEITSFGPKQKLKEFTAEESTIIKYSR